MQINNYKHNLKFHKCVVTSFMAYIMATFFNIFSNYRCIALLGDYYEIF